MTIQQCKYVLEIAKHGSFNEAAKQLFIAQSGLSGSVKALEQELGIKIFERSKNGVSLTGEGAEFVRYAAQIVEESDFVLTRYTSHQPHQHLHISTQHYDFIADIFGKMLTECNETTYKFSLCETRTHDVIRETETAYCDIGIIAIKEQDSEIMQRYLRKKGIEFTPLIKVASHVYMRHGHPLAAKENLTWSDLKDFPALSYAQGTHASSFFTEELMGGFESRKQIEISDRATLMNILLITDAYTVGTGIMPSALNQGNIISLPLQGNATYTIGYLLLTGKAISPITKDFIHRFTAFANEIDGNLLKNTEKNNF